MTLPKPLHLLRSRDPHGHSRVTFVELFFDLVFVFAITQLSHHLLGAFSLAGAAETALLLMAVWWVWIYTSWVTNWLDPDRAPVRVLLLVLMLGGLALSTSLPEAFGARGIGFSGAYVAMQVGRSLFMMWALRGASPANFCNFQRITLWLMLSGVVWLAGALVPAEGGGRLLVWVIALAIDYASPALGFFVPGMGRSTTQDWDVEGGHIAERCGLFVMIALGESVVVTGTAFGQAEWSGTVIAAFVANFVGTAAMWWIYFDRGAERGTQRIATADDPGRLARVAFTYLHLLIVAGIIVCAVADEFVQAEPGHHPGGGQIATLVGGPMLYLAGTLLFKWRIGGWFQLSHIAGLVMLAVLALVGGGLSVLALGAATSAVLVVVAVWETLTLPAGEAEESPP